MKIEFVFISKNSEVYKYRMKFSFLILTKYTYCKWSFPDYFTNYVNTLPVFSFSNRGFAKQIYKYLNRTNWYLKKYPYIDLCVRAHFSYPYCKKNVLCFTAHIVLVLTQLMYWTFAIFTSYATLTIITVTIVGHFLKEDSIR